MWATVTEIRRGGGNDELPKLECLRIANDPP